MADDTTAKVMIATLRKYGYDLEDPSQRASGSSEGSTPEASPSPSEGGMTMRLSSSTSILQLRERKNDQTALHIAAKKAHVDVLKALAKLPRVQEYVNLGDRHANAALHFAANCANKEVAMPMLELLFGMGASPDVVNVRGQTPLLTHIMTCKDDDPTITRYFVEQGLPLNDVVNGTTYLHMAVERNMLEIAGALVAGGASINVPDSNGAMLSDTIPHKTLVKLICYIKEGTQTASVSAVRNYCKICKAHRGLLETFTDCNLCGRVVCKNCSHKASEVKTMTNKVEDGEYSQASAKKEAKGRYCKVCCTVLLLRDKKKREKENFNKHLFGCGQK